MRHLIALASLLLILSGCFGGYLNQYPAEWAPLIATQRDCSEISGVYDNIGSRSGGLFLPSEEIVRDTYLSQILLADNINLPGEIALTVNKENLEVVANYSNGSERRRMFSLEKGEFSCQDGKIKIGYWGLPSGGFVISYYRESKTISKAQDGALIVELEGMGAGLGMLIVPFVGGGRDYHRYGIYSDQQ